MGEQENKASDTREDRRPEATSGTWRPPEGRNNLGERYRPVREKKPDPVALQNYRSRFGLFGAASALYALFYTFCLYRNSSGITWPFFVAGTLYYFGFCMKKCEVPWKKDAIFYVASLLLLGLSVCLTADGKILWMTKTGIFLLTFSFLLHHFYRDEGWGFGKYLSSILRSLGEVFKCLGFPFEDGGRWLAKQGKEESRKKWGYVLLGLLIAMPLLLVILALLWSADAVFEDLFYRIFGEISLGPILRVAFWLVFAFVGSYALIASMLRSRIVEENKESKKVEPLLAVSITLPIALVYLVFCGVQILYLFGGMGRLPEGYTWSSYARQGFFQLLAVCIINLALVLACLVLFQTSRALKMILTAISLMTYILIASSGYRMLLYIQNYYLTFLRLFVLWALAVIGLLMVGVIFAIYRQKFPLFRYCTVVVTLCYLGFAFAKPDYWIARYDMAHVDLNALANEAVVESGDGNREWGPFRDIGYLSRLSADAAPILARTEYREALLASPYHYTIRYYYNRTKIGAAQMGWRQFNFSRWLALQALEDWQVGPLD